VCGLKIYNNATTGTLLIEDQAQRDAHYAAWPPGKPVAVHAEGETVADILALVRKYRRRTHFCHISTAYEIDLLRAAKAGGLPVSIGVTPHHLYLTETDLPALGALGLMKPTLKTAADRDALWRAISDGVVDVVESDHAPHTLAEKSSPMPPYGVPGLETTLPLMCLAVEAGRITQDRMIELVATNPQRIFGLRPPPGTYTEVDTNAHYTIDRARLRSACGWSPFEGMRVPGLVTGVWIRGVRVYDGENVLVQPGFGKRAAQVLA
jgi:carbamoyl-phosphate synthase/aspartate carbamoyltransferase/dihydroorotase